MDYRTDADQPCRSCPLPRRRGSISSRLLMASAALWLTIVVAAFGFLAYQQYAPGKASTLSSRWPEASGLRPSRSGNTVVVFADPACPCVSATFTELERLRSMVAQPFRLYIVFEAKPGEDLSRSAYFRRVSAWRETIVQTDCFAKEMALFDAHTSGQVFIFDPRGALLFAGGLTGSRGEPGANPHLEQAMQAFQTPGTIEQMTPVYGCTLQ